MPVYALCMAVALLCVTVTHRWHLSHPAMGLLSFPKVAPCSSRELRKTKHELLNQICLSYAGFSLYPYEKSEKHLPGVIFSAKESLTEDLGAKSQAHPSLWVCQTALGSSAPSVTASSPVPASMQQCSSPSKLLPRCAPVSS